MYVAVKARGSAVERGAAFRMHRLQVLLVHVFRPNQKAFFPSVVVE